MYYRPGTTDVSFVYDMLFKPGRKAEYWLPEELEPKVIFDIGGNIGIAARYLAHRFPRATVHSFEPIPQNCQLLERNVADANIRVHPYALGARSQTAEFHVLGAEQGRWGYYSLTRRGDSSVRAEVRSVTDVLSELGDAVDIIKLDVEGAEREIIGAFRDEVIARATWVYGELHTEDLDPKLAFEVLQRLATWFDIEVHKGLRKQNWFFDACNRKLSERYRGFRRGR